MPSHWRWQRNFTQHVCQLAALSQFEIQVQFYLKNSRKTAPPRDQTAQMIAHR